MILLSIFDFRHLFLEPTLTYCNIFDENDNQLFRGRMSELPAKFNKQYVQSIFINAGTVEINIDTTFNGEL